MAKERKLTGPATIMSTTTKIIQSPYKEAAELKNGMFHFDFQASLRWMEKHGRILFGDHFRIYPKDHPVIYKLLVYAIGDAENTHKQGLAIGRGLLVSGPIGCGKTSLLTLVSYFCPPERQYQVKPARELSFEFEKEGYSIINRYSKGAFRPGKDRPIPVAYCFDDLGIEQPQKYFGNEYDVVAEILLSRYDLFISKRMVTHATTNLSASELEERYGNRVRSRMREMFNLVAFDKDSKDKRH